MTPVDIVMRSHNDRPLIEQTLAALRTQELPYRLIAFDNASSDGTRELLDDAAAKVIEVPSGQYVPGVVLNQAMAETTGEVVVFLNSDCTPQNEKWLSGLMEPLADKKVGAVYGRQIPRADCISLHARDLHQAYGNEKPAGWDHGFSMASSAIRRTAWEKIPFNESIQYSEDIEWTTQIKKHQYDVHYASDSIVAHSHNYNPLQFYKRNYGEGKAEASFLDWSVWKRSVVRYSLLPTAKQIINDWRYATHTSDWSLFWQSPVYRSFQMVGRRRGFKVGLKNIERYER